MRLLTIACISKNRLIRWPASSTNRVAAHDLSPSHQPDDAIAELLALLKHEDDQDDGECQLAEILHQRGQECRDSRQPDRALGLDHHSLQPMPTVDGASSSVFFWLSPFGETPESSSWLISTSILARPFDAAGNLFDRLCLGPMFSLYLGNSRSRLEIWAVTTQPTIPSTERRQTDGHENTLASVQYRAGEGPKPGGSAKR